MELRDNTWILFMSDNGWMMGDHGFTSKVLAYEESIRVPMMIAGPTTRPTVRDELVLGIDLSATILDLAGVGAPTNIHGNSLLPLTGEEVTAKWRGAFLYEAPQSQLESRPLWAIRTQRWKLIETHMDPGTGEVFHELYDLQNDPREMQNLANEPGQRDRVSELAAELSRMKKNIQ
jgi:arylsulfatase A-like enzyme